MKRTELKRKTPMARSGILRTAKKAPARMKDNRPKMTPIRKAARGEDCTLRIPGVCDCVPETTVLCHSPFLEDGRGMGLKSPDSCACFGGYSCHEVLDGRRPAPEGVTREVLKQLFNAAVKRTHARLREKGIEVNP